MINAQRAQTVQRAQLNMPYMQNYRVIQQPMPMYQQFPQMGFAPFSSGFGFNNYRVVPGLPITPPVPYQPYPQVRQPIPMAPPVYPGPGVILPPPPVYTAQPLYRAQGNGSNQGRQVMYVQPSVPQPPPNYNNVQVIQRNAYQQPPPQVIQMNYNVNRPNMNVPAGYANRGNNRGW